MIYFNPDINCLPTLQETVDFVSRSVAGLPVVHRGPFTPSLIGEDLFMLTRTDRMYSLKPNITQQAVLYGWTNDFQDYSMAIRASIFKDKSPDYLLNNVLKEDFEIVMESHPLFRLLKEGISLPRLRRPIQIYNPYGIAHSYGFKSHFISLTSSIDIAAFHACHEYDIERKAYVPITDCNRTGMIFVFELREPFSMIPNLSTVGGQPFARPGRNRLFVYLCSPSTNFGALPFVKGFQFRQNESSTNYYQTKFNNGETLFPKEIIADKANHILTSRTFSQLAFRRNLQNNPNDSAEVNLQRLEAAGYKMVENENPAFSRTELNGMWFDNVEEKWNAFWNNTVLNLLSEEQIIALKQLPDNLAYKRFFCAGDWYDYYYRS